jgi:hypothetical protein
MRKGELIEILLKAAEVSGYTEYVVIGSQAIHGTVADPDVEVVIRSSDADIYPVQGYGDQNSWYEELMLHLGQDSDHHVEANVYLEAVPTDLARLPPDWRERATTELIGSAQVGSESRAVYAIFPEIHDLTVSKIAIRREKDLEFLRGVVRLGLVDRTTLRERYDRAPRITKERLTEGLSDIDEAFGFHGVGDEREGTEE